MKSSLAQKPAQKADPGFTLFTDTEHSEAIMFLRNRPYSADEDPVEIRKKRVRRIVFSIATLFILLRLSLPHFLLNHVNNMLANRSDYSGHVDDVEVSLFQGGYIMKGVTLYHLREDGTKENTPFFTAPALHFSIDWQRVLRKGALVGKVVLKSAVSRPKKLYVKASIYHVKKAMKTLVFLPVDKFEISKDKDPAGYPYTMHN
jgi:hypothetical protein